MIVQAELVFSIWIYLCIFCLLLLPSIILYFWLLCFYLLICKFLPMSSKLMHELISIIFIHIAIIIYFMKACCMHISMKFTIRIEGMCVIRVLTHIHTNIKCNPQVYSALKKKLGLLVSILRKISWLIQRSNDTRYENNFTKWQWTLNENHCVPACVL